MKKIDYLNCLRTTFCFIVVISHFNLAFNPSFYPIIFNDGNFAVIYFLILSGFVMPLKYFNKKVSIKSSFFFAIKRYLRLFPVIFITILVSYLFLKNNLYYNVILAKKYDFTVLGQYFNFNYSLIDFIKEAFIYSFLRRPLLYTPFWTIKYEFIYIIIAFIVVNFLKNKKNRFFIYFLLLIVLFVLNKDIYCTCVFTGVIFSDLLYNNNLRDSYSDKIKEIIYKIFSKYWILIVAILFHILSVFCILSVFLRFISCSLLFLFVCTNEKIQSVLNNKLLLKLSTYSFEIYSIHWIVICSLSSYMMLHLTIYNWYIKCSIVFLISIIIIIILSTVLKKLENIFSKLEKNCCKLLNKE